MLDALNILTFLWLLSWATFAIYQLAIGKRYSILFILIVHFILSGVPLIFDVIIGKPSYLEDPGFFFASRDTMTSVIYCIYVSMVPLLWWAFGRKPITVGDEDANQQDSTSSTFPQYLKALFSILLISPLIALVLAPMPELYIKYGAAPLGILQIEGGRDVSSYHNLIIAPFCKLSLLASTGLLFPYKRFRLSLFMLVMPWITLAIWLDGKRNIFAIALFLYAYLLWSKGYLKNFKLLAALVAVAVVIGSFSYGYKSIVREKYDDSSSFADIYQDVRVDYGRDDVIKMTIFSEVYPEKMRILEYRGQSLLYYAGIFVPRGLWPDKPMPYAQYFTSAMLFVDPQELGWGMTTSTLEEAVANLSWLGMIVGPLVIALICRIGDSRKVELVRLLTILVASLLLAVELSAFLPIVLLWLFSVFWTKRLLRAESKKLSFSF